MIAITKSLSHEEFLKKKRKKRLWKMGIAVFVIFLIIGLASYISHRKEIRISKIELNGGILVTQADIESKALTHLYGSYFWLFPKGNAFLYPKDELEEYLKETFKRIDTIDIHRKGFQTLVINIKEKKPFAIWCNNPTVGTSTPITLMEDGSEDCYFMDQNSTVFAKAPYFSGDAYFKYYGPLATGTGEGFLGKEYMASTTEFAEVSNFITKTRELKIAPQYLVAKGDGEFSLMLAGGGEIYLDLKTPLDVVGQNLQALLKTPAFASTTGDLQVRYIDLRYGNKLFYKLK